MLVERLNELQRKLADGHLLDSGECSALIAELWRLKASMASKLIERDIALDDIAKLQAALDAAHGELADLHAMGDLAECPLANRWSNCAVRMRKQSATQP